MNRHYDIIIVGAGPAGAWTARTAAECGAAVLLLEKDREVGVPVRCAEGVSEKGMKLIFPSIPDRWIAQIITGGRLVAPDGTAVDAYPGERGFVLHRKLFDWDLAAMAVDSGAVLLCKANVKALIKENGKIAGVQAEVLGEKRSFFAPLVIGADGTESRIGRWAGIQTAVPYEDMDTCVQATMAGLDFDCTKVEFYVGDNIAPGGYAWVFPKGPDTANVGLGIGGAYAAEKRPVEYLYDFMDRRFPGKSAVTMVAGGVATAKPLKTLVADGLMLVGDAGRQANPLTGGGIVNALIAAEHAGKLAAKAVSDGDVSVRALMPYQKAWHKGEGKINRLSFKLKEAVYRFSDDDFNRTAQMLLKIPESKRTAFQIFKTALFNEPRLLIDAAKIFIT
ncbi:NAD(P)/FAD-dependent oxidoreductase [bacterium]|nr:NAD(P)/FAD-dependent oxidoreductase [bacterium]